MASFSGKPVRRGRRVFGGPYDGQRWSVGKKYHAAIVRTPRNVFVLYERCEANHWHFSNYLTEAQSTELIGDQEVPVLEIED